jgi:multicomponent Na+:H+ antiporter subunit F
VSAATVGAAAALTLLGGSLLLVLVRLVRGPDLANRVVALDLLSVLGVGIAAAAAVLSSDAAYLDIALILALIAFVSTVAFARYAERGGDR